MDNFQGFPKEGLDFLEKLSKNNNREWFHQHKMAFKEHLEAPAKGFVGAMEMRFEQLMPESRASQGEDIPHLP